MKLFQPNHIVLRKYLQWGKTEEEIQAEENENKKLEIQKQLDELDKKRIRAVCEPSMKTETQSWLDYYNEEIKKLREML